MCRGILSPFTSRRYSGRYGLSSSPSLPPSCLCLCLEASQVFPQTVYLRRYSIWRVWFVGTIFPTVFPNVPTHSMPIKIFLVRFTSPDLLFHCLSLSPI